MIPIDSESDRNIDMRSGNRKGILAEVAESLGVTRSTIYKRWQSRDAQTIEMVARALDKRERMIQRRKQRTNRLMAKIENC